MKFFSTKINVLLNFSSGFEVNSVFLFPHCQDETGRMMFKFRFFVVDCSNHFYLQYIIYLGFGATAIVDCAIAAAMCLILHEMSAGTERSENVLESIIQYFIGSGLLTR